eukprot:297676_1
MCSLKSNNTDNTTPHSQPDPHLKYTFFTPSTSHLYTTSTNNLTSIHKNTIYFHDFCCCHFLHLYTPSTTHHPPPYHIKQESVPLNTPSTHLYTPTFIHPTLHLYTPTITISLPTTPITTQITQCIAPPTRTTSIITLP